MRRALVIFLLLCSACGPLIPGSSGEKQFFVIVDNRAQVEVASAKRDIRLLVRDSKANRFINSHKIVFGKDKASRGFYQLAQWIEPPPERISLILLDRLGRANAFDTVARLGSSTLGDLQLNTELVEFYHDISDTPGVVRVRIDAELIDLEQRRIIAKAEFTKETEAKSYDAEGAVEAFTKAANDVVSDIVSWTLIETAESNL